MTLERDPAVTVRAVYEFVGERWFEHDFDKVEYNASEFDERVGMPGLHTVRPKLEAIERTPILPLEKFNRFAREAFWLDPKNNVGRVPVL